MVIWVLNIGFSLIHDIYRSCDLASLFKGVFLGIELESIMYGEFLGIELESIMYGKESTQPDGIHLRPMWYTKITCFSHFHVWNAMSIFFL